MHNICSDLRSAKKNIGLVPTMGALHEGHLSLLEFTQQRCDISIMSIYVNPTQFCPGEDFDRYPRSLTEDCEKAEKYGCDIIFAPGSEDMYPDNYMTYVSVEGITSKLEGASRPSHFRGVTTVVLKLLNIVMPHIAVFGQKDAQQAIVLKRMVKDLNLPVNLVVMPTIRGKDDLAISSRNAYLTDEERKEVPLIYKGLCKAENGYNRGELSTEKLRELIKAVYNKTNLFKVEYIEIVDTDTLEPVETVSEKTLIVVACRTQQSKTRLIDNIVLGGTL